MVKPYDEVHIKGNLYLRKFSKNLNSDQLQWHIDLEDRLVYSLLNTSWKVQLDNQFPVAITQTPLFIPKLIWHRAIKGNDDLFVYILK